MSPNTETITKNTSSSGIEPTLSSPTFLLSKSASLPSMPATNETTNTNSSLLQQQQQNALAVFARRSSIIASNSANLVTPTASLPSSNASLTSPLLSSSTSMVNMLSSSASSSNVIPISFVADFLHRLIKMLRDGNEQFIEWSDGKLHIHNPTTLASEILPKYYRHSKYSSFQRQLNYFGFRKISGKGKMSPCIYSNDVTTNDVFSILSLKRKPSFPSNKSMTSLKKSQKSLNNITQGSTTKTATNAPLLKKRHNCDTVVPGPTPAHNQGEANNHNFEFPLAQQPNQQHNPMMTMMMSHKNNPFCDIFTNNNGITAAGSTTIDFALNPNDKQTSTTTSSLQQSPQQQNIYSFSQGATVSNTTAQGVAPKQQDLNGNVSIGNHNFTVNDPLQILQNNNKRCVSTSPISSMEDNSNGISDIMFHMPMPLMPDELSQQQTQQTQYNPSFNNHHQQQQSFATSPNPFIIQSSSMMNNQQSQHQQYCSNDVMLSRQTIYNNQQQNLQVNPYNPSINTTQQQHNYNDMMINHDPLNDLDINNNTHNLNLSNSEFKEILNSLASTNDDNMLDNIFDNYCDNDGTSVPDLFSIDNSENTIATTHSTFTSTATGATTTNYFEKKQEELLQKKGDNIGIEPHSTVG